MSKGKSEPGGTVAAGFSIDPATGTGNASVKVTGIASLVKYFAPNRFAKAEALHALSEGLKRKLSQGTDLSQLAPIEQHLLLSAMEETLGKAANRTRILEYAAEDHAELKGLLQAPSGDAPSSDAPAAQEQVEEPTYFWERFWADAETVSVEYMQRLYARVLVGAVQRPGDFSLKTLDVIRYLDEDAARLFHAYRGFVVSGSGFPVLDHQITQDLVSTA
jgi:hypothetical protein